MDQDKIKTEELPIVKGGQGRTDAEVERAMLAWLLLLILSAVSVSVWLGLVIAEHFF